MLHRVYEGSPVKIGIAKRIFDVADAQGTPVWKARRATKEESLQDGEVFITHRRVTDDPECSQALTRIGVSSPVLVCEALWKLGELVDISFQSMAGMSQYREDTEIILSSVVSSQGKGSFARFARGLHHGCATDDTQLYSAIARSGMELFWDVLESVAGDQPYNHALQTMVDSRTQQQEGEVLAAWSDMFDLMEERHQKSHPFNFIGGDITLAEEALAILKYFATEEYEGRYKPLATLINASVPIVTSKIKEKKEKITTVEEENSIYDRFPYTR